MIRVRVESFFAKAGFASAPSGVGELMEDTMPIR